MQSDLHCRGGSEPSVSQQIHSFGSIPPPPTPPSSLLTSNIPPPPIPPPVIPPFFVPHFPVNPSQYPSQTFQSNVYSAPSWPTAHCTPSQVISREAREEESVKQTVSQTAIDDWLKQRGISKASSKNKVYNKVKIYAVREKLNATFSLIKELENDSRTLGVMVKTVSSPEWNQKCEEIETKKKKLMAVLSELKLNGEDVSALKEKCLKRSQKRARLRRRAERFKKQKEEEKVRCQNLNFQIDNWQREMQEGVQRVQREEELKKEADAVLWGVTQKKTEAQRQVALMSALLELRQVRVQRLTAAGKPVSQTQIETFNTVIERLKKMWMKHLDEYLLEEQALRGMLTEAVIKEDPVKTYKKLVLHEWETALFGSVGTIDSKLSKDELINIRCEWDQFAVQEHTVLATTVPPGWVLPVPPSHDQWHTLLKY